MRINLDIADDVLLAARELAWRDNKPVGEVLSALARQALCAHVSEQLASHGIHPLPARGGIVSNELVAHLRDVDGI